VTSSAVAIIVAAFALAGTGLSAYLSARAQRISSKVQEKAGLFEGYDEFVAHLRGRIGELEDALETTRNAVDRCANECHECRESLAATKLLVEVLRRELGLDPSADPFDLRFRKYGRRAGDPEKVPELEELKRDHDPDSTEQET
jgi:hypothetical protein